MYLGKIYYKFINVKFSTLLPLYMYVADQWQYRSKKTLRKYMIHVLRIVFYRLALVLMNLKDRAYILDVTKEN